jgi:retron-type reverse transcriptase
MMNEPTVLNVMKNVMPSSLLRQIAARPALYQAWRKVKANRGAAGIDGIGVHAFEPDLDANLTELSRNLLDVTYEPLPSRYVQIPKDNGKARELATPTVRDRVAQRAVLDRIEPLFAPQMLDCSFAFRAGRSAEMAVPRIVVARAQGRRWTVDADIEDFFPSINHKAYYTDTAIPQYGGKSQKEVFNEFNNRHGRNAGIGCHHEIFNVKSALIDRRSSVIALSTRFIEQLTFNGGINDGWFT